MLLLLIDTRSVLQFLKSPDMLKLFQEWRSKDCTKEAYDDILDHLEKWDDPKKFTGKLINVVLSIRFISYKLNDIIEIRYYKVKSVNFEAL